MTALIIADCTGSGRNLKAGQILTFEKTDKQAAREAAELYNGGRLVDDTPENRARLKAELHANRVK